jgi:hypothetical protein
MDAMNNFGKFQYAQDVLRDTASGMALSGFNRRVLGETYQDAFRSPHERQDASLFAGWDLADRMIAEGRLFYVHNFHHTLGTCRTCRDLDALELHDENAPQKARTK